MDVTYGRGSAAGSGYPFDRRDPYRHSWAYSTVTDRNIYQGPESGRLFNPCPLYRRHLHANAPSRSRRLSEYRPTAATRRPAKMGYDVDRFEGPINDGLLCCICRDILEEPLQAPCEHAFCSTCIQGWLVHESTCPEDRQPLYTTDLRPLFRYMKNDLDRLQIHCKYARAGCDVACNLENIIRHEDECEYNTITCPSEGCTVILERRELENHLKNCEFRPRECAQGCGVLVLKKNLVEHNCIAELRKSVESVRSEMACKLQEQKQEMELRLDAQRRHMVQKEASLQQNMQEMTSQLSRLSQEVTTLRDAESERQQELERSQLEQRELSHLGVMRASGTLDGAAGSDAKKPVCRPSRRSNKVDSI